MKKRLTALILASTMLLSLTACGGEQKPSASSENTSETSETSEAAEPAEIPSAEDVAAEEVNGDEYFGKSTDFTYMVANGITLPPEVVEMEDLPSFQYALSKDWDPDGNGNSRKVNVDIWTPPAGSESDYANTLASTGDYPDVMNIQIMSMSAAEMYEDGMILDITDYVNQYMPNYLKFFEENPEYAGRQLTMVDGEPRYLCLYHLDHTMPLPWGGMMYRRDWIVKYGKNPETGEPFSGQWEDDNWTDNVVFPSGETWPKYVSDWEWMLDIFKTALEEQGLTDGYAYSTTYTGQNGVMGDMEGGFGAGCGWYFDEDGKCVFGGDTEGFRTYLEMLNTWYNNGWMNPHFFENSNDMFFMVDVASVYSGKVGAWYGTIGQLGKTMDMSGGDESNPTNGIVVFGAPSPINDVYGDASVQGFEPFLDYAGGIFGAQLVITNKAEEKDLPALFTFLDYFYGPEGGVLKSSGMSKAQLEELRAVNPAAAEMYDTWGLSDGAYTELESGLISINPVCKEHEEIGSASSLVRFNGMSYQDNVDQGWKPYYQEIIDLYRIYDHSRSVGGEISAQFTPEENSEISSMQNEWMTYIGMAFPEFITGERDIYDDAAWESYCKDLETMNVQIYCDAVNRIVGK